jgi:hypothetical protein
MFEQYNVLQKLLRILIFVVLISTILLYVPESEIQKEDIIKVVSAISLVFIVYDFYYPAVKIELKKEDMELN